ncbi:MAG TPA: VOC family protein, partial [Gemmatimonadaceae bacterium]|nr:VOC family protein [Gemmatimonadaceae bacterium]
TPLTGTRMTIPPPPALGTIGWVDLTVPDAVAVRDFYAQVTGWSPTALSMGEYEDFVMSTPDGTGVGGICHARGRNAGIPPVWLVYITVADLDASLAACRAGGGTVLAEPRGAGGAARFAVIQDPAGATVALFDSGVRDAA